MGRGDAVRLQRRTAVTLFASDAYLAGRAMGLGVIHEVSKARLRCWLPAEGLERLGGE